MSDFDSNLGLIVRDNLPVTGEIVPTDSQDVFPPETVRQAIDNVVVLCGEGISSDPSEVSKNKIVWEATKEVLNRTYGKPRETVELRRTVRLMLDV
jgi:hypothetical protein